MATPGIVQNLYVQTGNQQILVSWDLSAGATSYIIQRSEDNVTYSTLATVSGDPLATSYVDTTADLETQYWYQVAAANDDGTSSYTMPQSAVAVPAGEMCLSQIRLSAQQRADRVNSKFVTLPEWNKFINLACNELYDLLITVYEDYFIAPSASFLTSNNTASYTLPNGTVEFLDDNGDEFVARPFYKLLGVDVAVNTNQNAYTTVTKFQFIDRNSYIYPNSTSAPYGVVNLKYRVMGNKIQFIPVPSGNQTIRLWYIPRLTELLQDTDTTDISISGWIDYVIVRAAKYALDKEESDTSKLDQEILFLKQRIEESAANRDAGQPDIISDTRRQDFGSGWGPSGNGTGGAGW